MVRLHVDGGAWGDAMSSTETIGDQIAALGVEIARLQAQLVRATAEAQRMEAWRCDGARNLDSWLVARLGVSRYTAAAVREVADGGSRLPAIAAVFDQGWVSFDEMRTLVQFVEPHEDTEWSRRAPETSLRDLQREARRRRRAERRTLERARARTVAAMVVRRTQSPLRAAGHFGRRRRIGRRRSLEAPRRAPAGPSRRNAVLAAATSRRPGANGLTAAGFRR